MSFLDYFDRLETKHGAPLRAFNELYKIVHPTIQVNLKNLAERREWCRVITGEVEPIGTSNPRDADMIYTACKWQVPYKSRRGASLVWSESRSKQRNDLQTAVSIRDVAKKVRAEYKLSEDATRELIERLNSAIHGYTIVVAEDADKIIDIYTRGPRSCMTSDHSFSSSEQPVIAYADSDFYVIGVYDEERDKYLARSVVCHTLKRYASIYADDTAARDILEAWLSENNYSENTDWGGARLSLHKDDNRCIGPYMDCDETALYEKDGFIYLGSSNGGSIIGSSRVSHDTGGYLTEGSSGDPCQSCDDYFDEDDLTSLIVGDYESISVCNSCIEEYVEVRGVGRNWIWRRSDDDDLIRPEDCDTIYADEAAATDHGFTENCEYEWRSDNVDVLGEDESYNPEDPDICQYTTEEGETYFVKDDDLVQSTFHQRQIPDPDCSAEVEAKLGSTVHSAVLDDYLFIDAATDEADGFENDWVPSDMCEFVTDSHGTQTLQFNQTPMEVAA
jgi:hypothetical protein